MMQRQGYKFNPTPEEEAAGRTAFMGLAAVLARQGIGRFTPGRT